MSAEKKVAMSDKERQKKKRDNENVTSPLLAMVGSTMLLIYDDTKRQRSDTGSNAIWRRRTYLPLNRLSR